MAKNNRKKMKEFNSSYDEENDDLFVYLKGTKSKGAVELGNFVFDFDEDENLIAIQIFDASQVLSKLISKVIELTNITKIEAEATKFRNMNVIKIKITTDKIKAEAPIIIPSLKVRSPSLDY